MDLLKRIWAYMKTPKFWALFAIITLTDFLFFNRTLTFVPLIPQLYELYARLGVDKVKQMWTKNTVTVPKPTPTPTVQQEAVQ